MNAIDQAFEASKKAGKPAFIPFLTIGDPDLETSISLIKALEAGGASMVELGVPYSDPLADGPVIQRASQRALRHAVTIESCIRTARLARKAGVRIPFILFTYFNPVLQLGLDHFFELVVNNEISGLIIPDLPTEEDAEVRALAAQHHIHLIPLVAPTSYDRIRRIVSQATGFIYCVSSLGVTGMRSQFAEGVDQFLQSVRAATDLPLAVGFGISNREQVERFSALCDGIVVGSAIVHEIEKAIPQLESPEHRSEGLEAIRKFAAVLTGNE